MSILVVGAGATGGYIGERLIAGEREVTFLVHPHTLSRLTSDGLRLRHGGELKTIGVQALTAIELDREFEVVVLAIRTDGVRSAINEFGPAVGDDTTIVPIMNGIGHTSLLAAEFGRQRALGAATRLAASASPDGTVVVVVPGIDMQVGLLDGGTSDALERTRSELDVPGLDISISDDIDAAMWEKFAFIASTATLTCLIGDEIGAIARVAGGVHVGLAVLSEVARIAAAEGHPLTEDTRARLAATLSDVTSTFGPSMFRDMRAGRPVEVAVLTELAALARANQIDTPLLDSAIVAIEVHNHRIDDQGIQTHL